MKFSRRIFALFALVLLCCFSVAEAVPVMPGVREHVQKDGSKVWYIPYGDEFLDFLTDMEGNLIAFGEDRDLYLAEWASEADLRGNESGRVIVLSNVKVQGVQASAKMAAPDKSAAKPMKNPPPPYVIERVHKGRDGGYERRAGTSQSPQYAPWIHRPLSGTRKILVIRVAFSDQSFFTQESLHSGYFFGDTNSIKKYFADQSRNTLKVESALGGTVIKNVTLLTAHPDMTLRNGTTEERHSHEVAFVTAAIAATGVNVASFDTNNDGRITPDELCIYLIVAGQEKSINQTAPRAVWAHAWSSFGGAHDVVANGKVITDWAMNGEMYDYTNNTPMGFAVVAHELGHQFCKLPDLYDVAGVNSGLGYFSLMAGGSWGYPFGGATQGTIPVNLDAWSRYYLGWETPQTAIANQMTLKNLSVGNGAGSMKQSLNGHRATEFFLTEVRDLTGWDKGLEGLLSTDSFNGGLLILHVDEEVGSGDLAVANNLNRYVKNGHQGVMAVEADGSNMNAPDQPGSTNSLWWKGNTAALNPDFAPPLSNFYTSATSNVKSINTDIRIKNIGTVVSGAMTVTISYVPVTGVTLNKTSTAFKVGTTETLTATVNPLNATNQTVSWSSSNTGVATVSNGLITGVAAGGATITVTTSDGDKTATCAVTITADVPVPEPPKPPKPVEPPKVVEIVKEAEVPTLEKMEDATDAGKIDESIKDNKDLKDAMDTLTETATNGKKYPKLDEVKQHVDRDINKDTMQQLESFALTLSADKKFIVVSYALPLSFDVTFDKIVIVKVLADTKTKPLKMKFDGILKEDGDFTIVRSADQKVVDKAAKPEKGEDYIVSWMIGDDALCDLDKREGKILDPAVIAEKTAVNPKGGGGGCSAAYLPFALLLAIPLFFRRKR